WTISTAPPSLLTTLLLSADRSHTLIRIPSLHRIISIPMPQPSTGTQTVPTSLLHSWNQCTTLTDTTTASCACSLPTVILTTTTLTSPSPRICMHLSARSSPSPHRKT